MGDGDTEDKATHQERGCGEDTQKCQEGAPTVTQVGKIRTAGGKGKTEPQHEREGLGKAQR